MAIAVAIVGVGVFPAGVVVAAVVRDATVGFDVVVAGDDVVVAALSVVLAVVVGVFAGVRCCWC